MPASLSSATPITSPVVYVAPYADGDGLDAVLLKGFWRWDDDSDHAVVLVVDDAIHVGCPLAEDGNVAKCSI